MELNILLENLDKQIKDYRDELEKLEEQRKALFKSMKNSRNPDEKSPEMAQETGKLLMVGQREYYLQGAISALDDFKSKIKRDFL